MESEAVFTNDSCKIFYEREDRYFHIKWFGFPRSLDFRKACNTVIDLMLKYKSGKLLTDNRNATVFSVSDQKWLNSEWLPRAIKVGYYCSATLTNDDVFINTAIKNISNKRDQNLVKTKLFTNEDEAIVWLKSI